jgi:isopentenyl-diphosphate Delta-isomerase
MQTTDPQDEIFDVVDENDRVIGTATRGQAHKDPSLVHRSVGVLVFRADGTVFLQRRSMTKDKYPGYWTCSVTGHVDSGETYDQAAVRELREEAGITGAALEELTTTIMREPNETERMRFYRCFSDAPITTHPVEIMDGSYVDLAKPFPPDMPVAPPLAFIRSYLLEKGLIR